MLLGDDPGMEVAAALYEVAFRASHVEATPAIHRLSAQELAGAVHQLRDDPTVIGASVTMPHTVAVVPLLDGLGPEAQEIKAVNTVSHRAGALVGWNTDRSGFAQALEEAGFQVKGRAALVLGAGGAARGCVEALRENAAKIWVTSPDLEQARAVCRDLKVATGGPTPLGSLSLVVNATPVGTDGRSVLFPIEWITPAQFVFDLIYQPAVTPLVEGARDRGARAINGLTMLLFQAFAAVEIWTGQPPPEAAMRGALERAVLDRLGA
jgi:shikimate dehydrogenase